MNYTLRELRIGDPHEAQLLADMWNASDAGWPGGWTGGVPETAERILELTRKIDRIAIFVVEVNGEIVGYGDVEKERGRDGVAYLDLLNVRPDCHGKGYGKALILKIMETIIEQGYTQLTIGTWAGNKKSVPLYKKTGFFWIPETSVHMQNFIPTVLGMPIAKDFFDKHYWYSCFKRELEAVPDDIEWKGIQVYPCRFEADGDLFATWIDRQSHAPLAIETNNLYASCVTGEKEIVCGLEYKVKWEIENKKGGEKPIQVALMAEGEEGIGLKVVENYEVKDKITIEKPFTIQPDIKSKERGMPAHQIKSTLLLDGVPVTLGTAVKPAQPVDIQFNTKMIVSGKPNEEVVVKLKSNLDFPVKGELLIDPNPALKFDKLSAPFSLEPKSWTSCTFYLKMDEKPGAFFTKMRVICPPAINPDHISGSALTTKAKTVTFLVHPLDSIYTWYNEEDKAITIETPTKWVRVELRGGSIKVQDRMNQRRFCEQRPSQLGPPFIDGHAVPPTYKYRMEQKDGKAAITIIVPSDSVPGVTIEKTVTVGPGNLIKIDHRIINTTGIAQKSKMRCRTWSELWEGGGKITLPLKDGFIHELCEGWGSFPMGDKDLTKKPEDYAESWAAFESSGLVTGMVFGECEEYENMGLQFDLPEIPPQSHYDLESFYLVVGHGNWELVRQMWKLLKQPSIIKEDRKPIVLPVLGADFDPKPLLITQPEMSTKLAINNRRGKVMNGKWELEECNLHVNPVSGDLMDVNKENPLIQEITVATSDLSPRVEMARIRVTEEVTTNEFKVPAVVLGNASEPINYGTECPEDGPAVISVDNGHMSFVVSPAFLGSVIALEQNGVNHLNSSYPKAGPYVWMNPWFGGIYPSIGWMGDQNFTKEKFTGEPVERAGESGIIWRGVRVTSDIEHKNNCWLRMEAEYLTIGHSNVLAVVQRVINRTDAPQEINSGLAFWLALGGDVSNNVLHYTKDRSRYGQTASTNEQERVSRHRRPNGYEFGTSAGKWAAVENPETGDVISLIASHPRTGIDIGSEGHESAAMFWAGNWTGLEPNESKETVLWLVLTDSVAKAHEYRALGEISGLP